MATSTLRLKKSQRMRVFFEGSTLPGVTAKDMIMHLIGHNMVMPGSVSPRYHLLAYDHSLNFVGALTNAE